MSNFKKMVKVRMAKTGESYQTAARHIRAKKEFGECSICGETLPPSGICVCPETWPEETKVK